MSKKLLVFGDSIMYGSGNGGVGVGEYLAKDLGFCLTKYCIGGARCGYYVGKNWIIEQVKTAIEKNEQADYIIFDGFTNDCYRTDGVNFDVPLGDITQGFDNFDIFKVEKTFTFSQCFENILWAFKTYFKGAKVLFVRPHEMGRREKEAQKIYGERAVELCKKWNVAVADIYAEGKMNTFLPEHRDKYTADTYGWGKGDSTHPNAEGYKKFYLPVIESKIKEL